MNDDKREPAAIDRLAYAGYRTYWQEPYIPAEPWQDMDERDRAEWRSVVRAILSEQIKIRLERDQD